MKEALAVNTFQLDCFLAVAGNLSFARAAEDLHVTQPAVTQQIRSLEKELGVRLFIRSTRLVRLTEEGRSFVHDARRISEIEKRAKKRFEKPCGEIATLSVGCLNTPSLFLMAETLERLASEFPDLHPSLQVVPFLQIYRLLAEGELDAVIGFRESKTMKIQAVYKELAKAPLVCVCAPSHPLARRAGVVQEELKNERLVLFEPDSTSPTVSEIQGRLMGGRAPSEFYFCDTGEAAVVLACAGYGISVIPDLCLPESLNAAKIPLTDVPPVSFGVYYKPQPSAKILKAFIQLLKKNFSLSMADCCLGAASY